MRYCQVEKEIVNTGSARVGNLLFQCSHLKWRHGRTESIRAQSFTHLANFLQQTALHGMLKMQSRCMYLLVCSFACCMSLILWAFDEARQEPTKMSSEVHHKSSLCWDHCLGLTDSGQLLDCFKGQKISESPRLYTWNKTRCHACPHISTMNQSCSNLNSPKFNMFPVLMMLLSWLLRKWNLSVCPLVERWSLAPVLLEYGCRKWFTRVQNQPT